MEVNFVSQDSILQLLPSLDMYVHSINYIKTNWLKQPIWLFILVKLTYNFVPLMNYHIWIYIVISEPVRYIRTAIYVVWHTDQEF